MICSLVHSAYSDKGRIIARAKAEGVLDKQTVSGKKNTARTTGAVTLTEKLKAAGCTEAEKRAIDIAKAADLLLGSLGLTTWPKSSDIPDDEADESKLELLRASNETLQSYLDASQARIAELEAALASAPTPAKSAKSAKSANGTKTSA